MEYLYLTDQIFDRLPLDEEEEETDCTVEVRDYLEDVKNYVDI